MAIKVFCRHPDFAGYQTNPPDIFLITVGYVVHQDTGGENNGPRWFDRMSTIYVPLGSGPTYIYQQVYDEILAACVEEGFDTPTKADMYAYTPMSMTLLLPD